MRRDNIQQQIALQVGIALTAGMFSIVPVAYGAPVGGTSTTATISYSDVKDANNVVIGQDTKVAGSVQNNVVDWHDFSVAEKEKVVFDGNKNYMNIVTGANTSDINGKIQGGGEVYIINPNGVIFGKNAEVNVGSFYVSTREVAVSDAIDAATAANSNGTGMSSVLATDKYTSGAAMDVVNMGKIQATEVVLEGENIRILNSANITSNGTTPLTDKVTVRADEGYIHVGSKDGTGGGYTSEKLTASGNAATVEKYKLVDSTNWKSTLGTGMAVSGNYMLSEDIDASKISNFKTVSSFTGKIDGNFYAVKKASGTSGLFASTNNATIVNMGVKDSTFSAAAADTGAFIKTAVNTTLINVYNDNSNITNAGSYSAGLVGRANGITIKSSYSTGNVRDGNSAAGAGLVGSFNGGTNNEVTDSYSTGVCRNGLFSNGSNGAKIVFNRTFSKGTAFSNGYNNATIKNSVLTDTGQYRVTGNSGKEEVKTGTIDLTRLTGITSLVAKNGTTSDPQSWSTVTDITNTGGLQHSGTKLVRPAWRIYEGKTAPVLTAFTKGIKNVVYDFEYFAKNKTTGQYTDKDTAAYKYSTRSDSTVGNNKGQDLTGYVYPVTTGTGESATTTPATPGLIYNAETLKIISVDGKAATSTNNNVINDKSAVFTTKGASTINGNVYYDAAGQKNAIANNGKKAFVWSEQNGYDLVGNNIAIAPRQVTITNNFDTQSIVKEYDGTEEAKDFVSGLFSGTSSSVSGILAADENDIKVSLNSGGTATFRNVNSDDSLTDAGTAGNEKVGANKRVQINGTVSLTNGSGGAYTGTNYVVVNAAGTSGNSVSINTAVPAAITQRQIKVSLNSGLGITKVYDGDAYVKDAQGNNRSFSSSDFNLDPESKILTADKNNTSKLDLTVTPSNNTKYIDLTTKQDQVDAGTHGVAIAGIALTGTSADNYVLTDMSGNPIYSKQDLVTGYNQTTQVGQNGGGTLYTSGDITLRQLATTGYKWYKSVAVATPHAPVYETATKEYDGKSSYTDPVNRWVSDAPTTASTTYTTTGMLAGDDLELQVTSADFTQNSTDINAASNPTVKDAYVSGASQGVRYNVKVTGTAAKNYTFDGTTALNSGDTAIVMGEGKITPRTIYITAPTAGTVTKKYNGNDVVENGGKTYFGLNDGYFTYADNNTYHHIVQDSNGNDDAQIVITGKYQNMVDSKGNTVLAKDVYYDAKNTTNPILDKNIVYTATIVQGMPQQTGSTLTVDPGTYASNNYRFNIAPNTNQVTFSGMGNITQAELGPLSFANVSKTFDNSYDLTNTNKTTAPQYTDDRIKLNTPTGIISGESVDKVFYVDSNGYLDTDGAALLQSGALTARYGRLSSAGFTPNEHVYRDGNNNVQPVSVEYAGVSSLLRNHNYKLDAATQASGKVYGTGTINPFLVTDKSWIKLLRNNTPIEKTYDGYDTISNPLQYLQTTGNLQNQASINIQTPAEKTLPGLSATVADAHYKTAHSNNDTSQDVIYDVNIIETGDYGIADGQNNPQNINLKNAQGQVELTLTSGGVIKRKEIIANNPKNANYTKTYDATDVINDTGNNLIDISNDILSIDKNRVTNATTAKYVDSTSGAGDAADASYTNGDKKVEYTLKLNGDSFNDYYLHNGNDGNLVTGVGTIDKRNLQITGNKTHTKAYDGNINVTDMPTALSGFNFGNSNDITVLTQDNFNMSALTGTYGTGNTDMSFTADSNVGSKDVQYSGFFTALGNRARNYTINGSTTGIGTAYGTGSITPAQFNGSFVLVLKQGIKQIYSGSNIVGKLENNTSAADIRAFQESWIDFQNSGIKLTATSTGIDVPLASIGSNNYTIDSAVFTAGSDVGKNKNVAYTISLNPTYVSSNYTGMPTTALLQGSINDGEIKAREVTVDLTALAKGGLSKYYDNTGTIYNNDNKAYSTDMATGTVLTGDSIIKLAPVNTTNHTGLVKGTNASTGAYTNVDAGPNKNKTIEYTVNISGDKLSNYIFKDANGNVLYDYYNANGPQQMTPITTNNNTIKAFGVVVTADQIAKPYDATDYVAPATAQNALHLGKGVDNDVISLQNPSGITARYVGVNVDDNGDGTPDVHAVNYTGLDLGVTGSALTNYQLVDSNGNALGTDTNGLRKFAGTGIINPYKLIAGDVTINIGDASKTYDATKDVLKNGSVTDLTNNYITDHYVTIPNTSGGTQENIVFTSYNAEYNEANATANPVKPGNRVDYRLGLSNSNYDFSGLQAAGLVNNNNEWVTSAGGTIDKAVVKTGLTNNPLDNTIVKTYDGKNNVIQDVTGKVSVAGLLTAKDGTVLNVNAINAQYKDKNVARDANGNVVDKDVYYHVELSGAAKDNYTIVGATGADYASLTDNTGTLTGTGRITPKELTIDFKPAERDYNGKANVNAADIQVEKFNGLQGNDSITLDSTALGKIAGTYGTGDSTADFTADGNVNRNGDAVGAKSVKYEHVADAYADYLARNLNTDAANYTVAKDTFYKESDNKGKINPVVLSDIKAKWQGVDKVYDATANVLNPENTMKLVTKDTALTGKEIELTYTGAASGVYVDSNGAAQKDVGNHGLKYSVTEVKKNLGNYQLADSAADSAKRDWLSTTAADNADGQAVTGAITPLTLNVIAQDGFHKIYDGTEDIADSEVQAKIGFDAAQAAVVQRDIAAGEISYDVDAHYVGSDANVAPGVIRNQKDIAYSLTLKGNTKGNYILQGAVNDMVTDTARLGDIEQRMVYVEPLNITGIDKTYDTTDAMSDGYSGNGRFRLKAADDSTGIVGNEDVSLDVEAIQGAYKSAHVQRDADGKPVSQEITFNNFTLKGSANLNNYLMATDSLTGSGTITPAPLTVSINKAPTKVYDGGTSFTEEYTANHNLSVQGWLQDADKVNAVLTDGGYTDANAGTNKEYSYNLNVGNDDYELTQGVGRPALRITDNGQSGQITAQDGTITPRTLTVGVIGTMNKEYDGTTDGAENAVANVSMSNVVNGDSLGLTATAVYDNPDAGKSEDTDELQEHQVTYTLSLANPNYQLETNTVTGTGTISRRGLTIVATPAGVNMGEPLPKFTGTVEGLVDADSGLASSFTFNTLPGVSTSNVTGAQTRYPVYGWYRNSYEGGNFGLNYTYSQAPANETAFTVNYINTDMGNPDLKPTPTHDVYRQIAKDVTSGFGDTNAASLQYVDRNGKVIATETIGSGTIAAGETMSELTVQGTDLANIGIVGGDIVNLEGAEAAGIADIEMQDKGAVVNLKVYSLNGEKTSADGNPAAEIVSTDSSNALGSIQIVDESGNVLEEIDQDKAEKQEKEGEIAIQSSDGQNENEIELTVESTGVNVA